MINLELDGTSSFHLFLFILYFYCRHPLESVTTSSLIRRQDVLLPALHTVLLSDKILGLTKTSIKMGMANSHVMLYYCQCKGLNDEKFFQKMLQGYNIHSRNTVSEVEFS